MLKTKMLLLALSAVGATLGAPGTASAQSSTTIYSALGTNSPFNTMRSAGDAPMGVTTFDLPTTISSFGVYDAMTTAGTQTFLIFNQVSGALLYQSAAKAFAGDGSTSLSADSYKMSDDFLFTFLPSITYAIGATSSVSTRYYVAFDSVSQNGITVTNGNSRVIGTTLSSDQACCSTGLKFVVPNAVGAVPEPATWAMMIVGLSAIGFAMRRKNVTTRVQFA